MILGNNGGHIDILLNKYRYSNRPRVKRDICDVLNSFKSLMPNVMLFNNFNIIIFYNNFNIRKEV